MNTIKTFEDACQKLGLNPEEFVLTCPETFTQAKAIIAHTKLVVIAEALNDGWVPDWTNGKGDKWYAWFKMGGSSGSGFAFYDAGLWYSFSTAGSRLCFKSEELAEYAGEQFLDLYKEAFVIA